MKRVDARGLSCPEPVIQTKNAMASKEAEYEVLVDNVVAKENVSRFVMHQGYQVNVEEQGDDFLLKIMGDYIATFFSHFGAMSFKKKCEKEGYPATIMPVPRNLSSSCGTCVKFTGEAQTAQNWNSDEVEQLVKILETGSFQVIWHS